MRNLILGILFSLGLASCVVSDPYEPNPLNNRNLKDYCTEIFEQDVKENIECFYNLYYAAKFLQACAEEQVSAKYDNIRTGLKKHGSSYSFDSMGFTFSKEDPFIIGSVWKADKQYGHSVKITMNSETEWRIVSEADNTTILLTLLSADDAGMKMNIHVKGKWTEESSYTATFEGENIEVELVNEMPIALKNSCYDGLLSFVFFKRTTRILECDMTLN